MMTETPVALPEFFEPELMIAGDVPFEDRRASLLAAARAFLDCHRDACLEIGFEVWI